MSLVFEGFSGAIPRFRELQPRVPAKTAKMMPPSVRLRSHWPSGKYTRLISSMFSWKILSSMVFPLKPPYFPASHGWLPEGIVLGLELVGDVFSVLNGFLISCSVHVHCDCLILELEAAISTVFATFWSWNLSFSMATFWCSNGSAAWYFATRAHFECGSRFILGWLGLVWGLFRVGLGLINLGLRL